MNATLGQTQRKYRRLKVSEFTDSNVLLKCTLSVTLKKYLSRHQSYNLFE